jgi:hypothetical protein
LTNDNAAVFPLWNLSGQILGTHQYRPDRTKEKNNDPREGRYFTRVFNKPGTVVWGLESWNLSNTLFVCEGLFDACRLTNVGMSAVAVFSYVLNPSVASWLYTVGRFRPVVFICDNDSSGVKLSEYSTSSVVVEKYKDLGEASQEYVLELCRQFK